MIYFSHTDDGWVDSRNPDFLIEVAFPSHLGSELIEQYKKLTFESVADLKKWELEERK